MPFTHTIAIAATPQSVWDVTIDVERWPQWTPTITAVRRREPGPFQLGSTAAVRQPRQPLRVWTVTTFEPPQRFVWETRSIGLRMVGSHEIVATPTGCESRLRLDVTGPFGCVVALLFGRAIRTALATENEGLQARCQAS